MTSKAEVTFDLNNIVTISVVRVLDEIIETAREAQIDIDEDDYTPSWAYGYKQIVDMAASLITDLTGRERAE